MPLGILHGMGIASQRFPEIEGQQQHSERAQEREGDGKAQCGRLIQGGVDAEHPERPVHESGRIDSSSGQHGDHESDRLPPGQLLQDRVPFARAAAFGQGVVDNRLVGPAGQPLGKAAQDPVRQAEEKENRAAIPRGKAENRHLSDHAAPGRDQ